MQLIPIQTPLLQEGDDLASILTREHVLRHGDILAVSSKAAATVEGAHIDLATLTVTDEAHRWVSTLHRDTPDPQFRQAVLEETERLHGTVLESCPQAMLCELRPNGLESGTILAANAGLDRSNSKENTAIGWPHDPVHSVRNLREQLIRNFAHSQFRSQERISESANQRLGVLITDSCCRPRRVGVTAIALVVSGFDPLQSHIGSKDLFGHTLMMTQEAVADQLATAANFVMGNAAESIPAVLIRDHGIPMTNFEGWVPGIEPEEDLFLGIG